MMFRPFHRRSIDCARRSGSRRGFTLVELIIAILVLGIGLVTLAAVFPAGIAQQQFANDDVYGRIVADHAISVIRNKVSPEDFGSFEQFYQLDARPTGGGGTPELPYRVAGGQFARGVPSDWSWKRPGFVFDNGATSFDEGKIDIFSWEATRLGLGIQPQLALAAGQALLAVDGSLARATEFPFAQVPPTGDVPNALLPPTRHTLYGIPYNRDKYDSDLGAATAETEVYEYDFSNGGAPLRRAKEPAHYIMQSERTWPQGAGTRTSPGQYYWECMFRRFQGKVYVAIFVYRVAPPGGEPRPYTVAQASINPALLGQPQSNPNLPPLPATVRLDNGANQGGAKQLWSSGTDVITPGTNANSAFNAGAQYDAWQLPAQWILDKFNNIHRVVNGRRAPANGPVRLARPLSAIPPVPALVGQANGPSGGDMAAQNIDQIWFLPGRDAAGNALIPVFCTVQEL